MKPALLLLSVLMLFGCAETRDTTHGVSNICPVHRIPMAKLPAKIVDHADIRADLVKDALVAQQSGVKNVHATLFPFSETRAHTHRDISPPDIILLFVCSECVRTRDSWRKAKTANKAPEPTPLPVTIPAEPGIAPGSGVAHL